MKKVLAASLTGVFSATLYAATPGFNISAGAGVSTMPVYLDFRGLDFPGSGGTVTVNRFDAFAFNSDLKIAPLVALAYNFTPFLGAEVFYTYLGKRTLRAFNNIDIAPTFGPPDFSGTLRNDAVGINANVYFPVNNLDLIGKIGISRIGTNFSVSDPQAFIFNNPGFYRNNFGTFGFNYGTGLQYQFTPRLFAGIQIERFAQFNAYRAQNLNFTLAAVTIGYNFAALPVLTEK